MSKRIKVYCDFCAEEIKDTDYLQEDLKICECCKEQIRKVKFDEKAIEYFMIKLFSGLMIKEGYRHLVKFDKFRLMMPIYAKRLKLKQKNRPDKKKAVKVSLSQEYKDANIMPTIVFEVVETEDFKE